MGSSHGDGREDAHFQKYFAKSASEEAVCRRLFGTVLHKGQLCLSPAAETRQPCCYDFWWYGKYWLCLSGDNPLSHFSHVFSEKLVSPF